MKTWILSLVMILSWGYSLAEVSDLPDFMAPANTVTQQCNQNYGQAIKDIESTLSVSGKKTFDNLVVPFNRGLTKIYEGFDYNEFLSLVHTDENVRKAGEACMTKSQDLLVTVFARPDLYQVLSSYAKTRDGKRLKGDKEKLLKDIMRNFALFGSEIEDQVTREKVIALKKQLAELSATFSKNISKSVLKNSFTASELKGVDKNYLSGLKKDSQGKYIVTTAYPDYVPLMKSADREKTREKMLRLFFQRGGKENVNVLEKMLSVREEIANLSGYKTHSDYVFALRGRMAKSKQEVSVFLQSLAEKLSGLRDQELADLRAFKCEWVLGKTCDASQIESTHVELWDTSYLFEKKKQSLGQIDSEKIREYFPIDHVLSAMFDIYQQILGVHFEKNTEVELWNDQVFAYKVHDKKSNDLLGYFFLDLYPREGKYTHAASFSARARAKKDDGNIQIPFNIVAANFNAPTQDRPSLLSHDEVETLFHEFGHVMESMLKETNFYMQSQMPRDFVEAPSQMMESWVWQPQTIKMMSKHYKTGESLPDEVLKKMIELKQLGQALGYTSQVIYAQMDLDFHSNPEAAKDTQKHIQKLYADLVGLELEDNMYRQASFGHLAGVNTDTDGYDSAYYGYLWSEVYAKDMFTKFEEKGILNPKVGMAYRKEILAPGSSRSVDVSLKKFLGRKPSDQAFFDELGLKPLK